jgi:hypothetical protein
MDKKEYMYIWRKINSDKIKIYKQRYKLLYPKKVKQQYKNYYNKNKEKITIWRKEHNDLIRNRCKLSRLKYRDKYLQSKREAYKKNKHKYALYMRRKRRIDLCFRLKGNLRHRVYMAIKYNKKSTNTITLIGCPIEQLKTHLEKQFTPGMNWKNYGKWHVDHIKPCSLFDLSVPEEQCKCFHYTNLQPLWAKENRVKSNKVK